MPQEWVGCALYWYTRRSLLSIRVFLAVFLDGVVLPAITDLTLEASAMPTRKAFADLKVRTGVPRVALTAIGRAIRIHQQAVDDNDNDIGVHPK